MRRAGSSGAAMVGFVAVLAGLAPSRPALAQAQRGHREDNRDEEARELSDQGLRHYNLGEFDQAIQAFKAAYALSAVPLLLFNIAQAYRLEHDCAGALEFYRRYLSVQAATFNRAQVEGHMAEMSRCLEAARAPAPTPALVESRDRPEPRDRPGGGKRLLGLALGGAGLALAATGAYFAFQAADASDQLQGACRSGCAFSDPNLARLDSDGQRDADAARLLLLAGGGLVVGGAVLYALGWRQGAEGSRGARLALGVTPGGTGVSWSAAF